MLKRKVIFGSVTMMSVLAAVATFAASRGGEEFSLSWYTIDGGGAMQASGGDFELSATIGQPDAGTMTGGDFEMTGGFWFPIVTGDCNADGGVNLFEFDSFQGCVTGPDGGSVSPDCACFDFDDDDSVDLLD